MMFPETKKWFKSGEPMIWLNAAAVSISLIIVIGLLVLIAVRGLGHFWPKPVMEAVYVAPDNAEFKLMGEIHDTEEVSIASLIELGVNIDTKNEWVERSLIKTGNRDITGSDFRWVFHDFINKQHFPADAVTLERREWGNFYGYLGSIKENGEQVAGIETAWEELQSRLKRVHNLHSEIRDIEKGDIGEINYEI